MLDLFNLSGKTALVTGASSGLGQRFSYTLAKAGAKVYMCARRLEKLTELADKYKKEGLNIEVIQMNVADKLSVRNAFYQIEKNGDKIDICVNNAGISKKTPVFDDNDNDDFETVMQTNLNGVWYVAKEASKFMKKHNIEGSIINISSVRGATCLAPIYTAYAVSKAAVIHLTKSLVKELGQFKIRINCIIPGLFHTPLTDDRLNTEEKRQAIADSLPLKTIGNVEDMDGLILYLASNKASRYVTGACITIDGGNSS